MKIKALAPIIGKFEGKGSLLDGTEVTARFSGEEVIPNLCYGLRLEVLSNETRDHVVNAYIVVSTDKNSHDINLRLIETKESFENLSRNESLEGAGENTYAFEAQRSTGGIYRIQFDLQSAQRFDMNVKITNRSGSLEKELWKLRFDRVHISVSDAA